MFALDSFHFFHAGKALYWHILPKTAFANNMVVLKLWVTKRDQNGSKWLYLGAKLGIQ